MRFNLTTLTIQFKTDNDEALLFVAALYHLFLKCCYQIGYEIRAIKDDFVAAAGIVLVIKWVRWRAWAWGVFGI